MPIRRPPRPLIRNLSNTVTWLSGWHQIRNWPASCLSCHLKQEVVEFSGLHGLTAQGSVLISVLRSSKTNPNGFSEDLEAKIKELFLFSKPEYWEFWPGRLTLSFDLEVRARIQTKCDSPRFLPENATTSATQRFVLRSSQKSQRFPNQVMCGGSCNGEKNCKIPNYTRGITEKWQSHTSRQN